MDPQIDGSFLPRLLVWYAVFLFSVTLHEAMHSFVSLRGGDPTAANSGQATLNPLPHIQRSKFGMIVVPLLSFFMNGGQWMIGWASAPFNPYWAARYPKRSFLMSLAGPLSHVPAVIVSFAGLVLLARFGLMGAESGVLWGVEYLLQVVFILNTTLLVFNLIPIPPLDGSEVWYLFVRREEDRLRYRMQTAGYQIVGLVLAWKVFDYIAAPVARFMGYAFHLFVTL